MRRKSTQVLMLSLLLTGAATFFGGYVYADDDNSTSTTVEVQYPPYKPSNLTATVGTQNADGTATVTLTFTTPSKSYDTFWEEVLDADEYPLTEITKIVVAERYYDDDEFEYVYTEVAAVTDGIKIGTEMSIELLNQAEGKHTYYVFALNSKSKEKLGSNDGSYATSDEVTVGTVYEAPAAVTDLKYVNNYPNIELTWTAPTAGEDGGVFKADELTYTVYRNNEEIKSGLTETKFTDVLDVKEPTGLQYAVVASTKAGNSYQTKTDAFVVGPAYTLPFAETFPNGSASKVWTKSTSNTEFTVNTYISSYSGVQTGFDSKLTNGYDADGGALYIKCNSTWYDSSTEPVDTYGTYTSAPISLAGVNSPVLSFYQYVVPNVKNNLKASIIVTADGVDKTAAEYTFNEEGTEGWLQRSVSLAEFAGKTVNITFRGDCTNDTPGFTAFDKIVIEDAKDNDLVLNALNAPTNINAGDEYTVIADIYNKGAKEATNFTVELYLNEKLFKSETVASLAAGASKTVTFTATADNSYGTAAAFEAKVIFTADEDQTNNSATATATVKTAATPAATSLTANQVNQTVQLAWTAPDYILPASVKVTESFENYDNAAKTFGNWTMSAAHSYGPDFEDFDIDEDMFTGTATYTVVDSEALDAGTSWYGKAATGTHYLMNVGRYYAYRTDWLISPVLSGEAQTVTFKIASHKFITDWYGDEVPDQVKVYYSTKTNDTSDFETAVVNQNITKSLKKDGEYETITAELPAGAKYFAIVITNKDDEYGESIVFIDDITFTQGQDGIQATLLGYDIYDGETKLNDAPVAETSYTVNSPAAGSHSYTVVAVYNVGSSVASNVADVAFSGVANINADAVSVFAAAGQLHINAAEAQVYDIAGRVIAKTVGNTVLSVARGTYIVRADNKSFKVLVK
jgi:hypothetical protein